MRYGDLIEEPGPPVSEELIQTFERSHGLMLPRLYREFLLRHNGGTLYPNEVDVSGLPGSPTDLRYLFGLGMGSPSLDLSEWLSRPELNRDVPAGQIQIGYDSVGRAYTMELSGTSAGAIHYVDESGTYRLAEDLEELFRERIRLVAPRP